MSGVWGVTFRAESVNEMYRSAKRWRLLTRRAGIALALATSGCASFDSLLAKSRPSEAQEHLTTESELRRLVAAYDAESIPIHVRRVDRARALRALGELDHTPDTRQRFGELFDRTAYFTVVADRSPTGLDLRWQFRGEDIQFVTPRTSTSSLAVVTGEAPPAECRTDVHQPNFPVLARVMNPLLKQTPLPTFADKPYTVTSCPSKYEEVRTAPLATGLSLALDTSTHAKDLGMPFELNDERRLAIGAAPALGDARVAICARGRSWTDVSQLALRFEGSLHDIEAFFAKEPRLVPLGKAPFTRSVVFVSGDRVLVEGGDSAVDCLYEPFDAPLAKRIAALKLERQQRQQTKSRVP